MTDNSAEITINNIIKDLRQKRNTTEADFESEVRRFSTILGLDPYYLDNVVEAVDDLMDRISMNEDEKEPKTKSSSMILDFFSLKEENFNYNLQFIIGMLILFKIISFILLKRMVSNKNFA